MRYLFSQNNQFPFISELCVMACNNTVIDLCDTGNLPGTPFRDTRNMFPMLWRFFPTLDPQVDIYLSRDLDSRFSLREVSAVTDWLTNSVEPIHVMRDNMMHDIPMIGCSWGAHLERKNARWHWVKSWSDIMRDPITFSPRSVKGPDQVVLAKYVWSWGRCNSLQHDSYTCQIFPGTRPFPTQRPIEPNNFIGAISVSNGTYLTPCPKLCRPKLHQHWTYC